MKGVIPPLAPPSEIAYACDDPMNLLPTEVDAFLKFLFTTLARKPRRLNLRKTAQVARYLDAIVYGMREGRERAALEDLAKTIWLAISRLTQVEFAEKEDVIAFLREHAATYLNSFDIKMIEKLIEGRPAPTKQPFRPSALMGTGRSHSATPARLQNDLTERIFAAYHALRRVNVKRARRRVAKALNQFGIETETRSTTSTEWGSDEVMERVKQFQNRLNRGLLAQQPREISNAELISRRRVERIDEWISEFRASARSQTGGQLLIVALVQETKALGSDCTWLM